VPAFQVKLGANDLNCVDVPVNPTHSLSLFIRDVPDFSFQNNECMSVTVFLSSNMLPEFFLGYV